jgi:sec-independent protein translocase protein TatB
MFDIGLPELLVIALVALLVFGPDRLPEMAAQFGRFVASLRVKANSATSEIKKSADVTGLSDIATDLKGLSPKGLLNDSGKTKSEPEVQAVFDPDAT